MEVDILRIIKNIISKELYLLGFLVFPETLRLLMKAGETESTDLKQSIIMFLAVAILAVIQQIIKDKYFKNHDRRIKTK